MNKLKVAVIIEENCLPTEGGGYSYYQTLVKKIDEFQFSDELDLVYLLPPIAQNGFPFLKKAINVRPGFFNKISVAILHKLYRVIHWIFPQGSHHMLDEISRIMSRLNNDSAVLAMQQNGIELAYYLKPNEYPVDFPIITTHWDVGHKSMYPFPEVAAKGNYKKRESYYAHILEKAVLILCESEAGSQELRHYYRVNPDKVKVLPLFGGEVIHLTQSEREEASVLEKYGLVKGRFFLYPAQFWAHKNHYNLVRAFKRFCDARNSMDIQLVLCGGDQGNMSYIVNEVNSLGLKANVRITGFVDNRVLHSFYKNAIAVVMPTYLGPTNLPLIEAAMLNCAVACTDMAGHREILGETALYFNPSKEEEISASMEMLMNEETRSTLVEKAAVQIRNSPFHVDKSVTTLERILLDIKPVRKAWGSLPGLMSILSYANIGTIESLIF